MGHLLTMETGYYAVNGGAVGCQQVRGCFRWAIRLGVAAFGCERLEASESSLGVPFQRGDRVVAQPGDG